MRDGTVLLLAAIVILLSLAIRWEGYSEEPPDVIYVCFDGPGTSGTPVVPQPPKPKPRPNPCQIEVNTDYYGNTYHTQKAKNADECCALCNRDAQRCRSWTYDGKAGVCRLKDQMRANRSNCGHRTSGYLSEEKTGCPQTIDRIVTNFDCTKASYMPNRLKDTNRFTLFIRLTLKAQPSKDWNHLLHAGDESSTRRTPGIWIYDGYLHIRASSQGNQNDGEGCWTIKPKLEVNRQYDLVVVYNRTEITAYLDGNRVANCPTKGEIVPERNLFIGKSSVFPVLSATLTLGYIDRALDPEQVKVCRAKWAA